MSSRFVKATTGLSVLAAGVAATANFSWSAITPTHDLRYHDCYGGYRCARLEMPMDWQNQADNRTVALALTALPATVPEDDPSFGGTLVVIQGGPGASGVDLVQTLGHMFQQAIQRNKNYEILSYDARGVGFSTPAIDCFGGDMLARAAFQIKQYGAGPLDRSRDGLERQWALSDAYATVCQQTLQESGILHHVSTAAAARDIVEIVDRIEELRRRTAKNSTALATHEDGKPAVPRLLGLGLSYGSVVANTFASMYPGRIGRLISDAVDDAYNYMGGYWSSNIIDVEKLVQYFYDSCFEVAGDCPLWTKDDADGAAIKARVDSFIYSADLVPFPISMDKDVFTVTGSDIRRTFRPPFYAPLTGFRTQAQLLADMLRGNYTLLVAALRVPSIPASCSNITTLDTDLQLDALSAIACSDATDSNYDIDYYADYIQQLKDQSPTWGESWATIRFSCSNWKVPAKWRFTGPFTAPPADPSIKDGVPAAPLLFLSSKIDPACPLAGAQRMSAGYPGSVVVTQNSYGHAALGSGWSQCTNKVLQDYLEDGLLPPSGKVCETNCKPFKEAQCDQPRLKRDLRSSGFLGAADLVPRLGGLYNGGGSRSQYRR